MAFALLGWGMAHYSDPPIRLRQAILACSLGHLASERTELIQSACRLTRLWPIRATIPAKVCQIRSKIRSGWSHHRRGSQRDRFALISASTVCETRKLVFRSSVTASSKLTSPACSASSRIESVPATLRPLRTASCRLACSSISNTSACRRERDRLALTRIELNPKQALLRTYNVHPRRFIDSPVVDQFGRKGMPEFRQDRRWNENPLV